MLWWHWLLLGLVLTALEMAASGGFYIIFFGVAAVIVALLALAGLAGPLWLQMLLFSALSVGIAAVLPQSDHAAAQSRAPARRTSTPWPLKPDR